MKLALNMNIHQIKENGFPIQEARTKLQNVAFISLRTALLSFFRTYQSLRYNIRFLDDDDFFTSADKDRKLNISYIENVCTAITSFQHFAELVIKDILNKEHPLLAIDASRKHTVFYDLLNRRDVPELEWINVKQLEFSEALKRLLALIDTNRLDRDKYGFLATSNTRSFLEALNHLRNRIAHRGVFVLRYPALDHLFGEYALPFLLQVISLDEYKDMHFWKYTPLHVDLDPINSIVDCFETEGYNKYKVAVLKELARAGYENPLMFSAKRGGRDALGFDSETIKRAEALSKHVSQAEYSPNIKACPVCGLQTLVAFPDSVDDYDEKTGQTIEYYEYIYKVKCFCCSLELDREVYGETGLPTDDLFVLQ